MRAGHATPTATRAFARRYPDVVYSPLGSTGLTVSPAGFGGYRVAAGIDAHETALVRALSAGINLVDTSANYADGDSERLVGRVLGRLTTAGAVDREEVVVVTKAGYLQGRNYALSQERLRQGRPFPERVEYGRGLEHCIHPEFLADQIDRSLERLGLETLDVALLHNPEYYLNQAARDGMALEKARREYYRRIAKRPVPPGRPRRSAHGRRRRGPLPPAGTGRIGDRLLPDLSSVAGRRRQTARTDPSPAVGG